MELFYDAVDSYIFSSFCGTKNVLRTLISALFLLLHLGLGCHFLPFEGPCAVFLEAASCYDLPCLLNLVFVKDVEASGALQDVLSLLDLCVKRDVFCEQGFLDVMIEDP